MKTLKESLFDKDLVQRSANLTIRDVYDLNPVYNHKPSGYIISGGLFSIVGFFDPDKLMRYKNPWDDNWFSPQGQRWVGIIMDLPLPPMNSNSKAWCNHFKDKLLPYVLNSHKENWKHTDVTYEYSSNNNALTIILYYQKNSSYSKIELNFTRK